MPAENTQTRILEWERYAYRACDLCVWGADKIDDMQQERMRVCLNPHVMGGVRTPVVPVALARAKIDGTKWEQVPQHMRSHALGACGPEAKYLSFPGLIK